MTARMQIEPPEPFEHSRTVTPPLTIHGTEKGSDDRCTHMKLEPPAKFVRKGLPTICDWVEETENWLEMSLCTPD